MTYAEARANGTRTHGKNGAHVGATEAIREALKLGPASCYMIQLRTGLPVRTVNSLLHQLVVRSGGVIKTGTRRSTKYALYVAPEPKPNNCSIALPNRGHEWKPLNRDPLAHMKLAMVTR